MKDGSSLLEMASDANTKGQCHSFYATEPWQNPTPAATSWLSGSILNKSGPSDARTWKIDIENGSNQVANATQITGVALQQSRGAACTPAFVGKQFPLAVGNIRPGDSAEIPVVIDFSTCQVSATFTVTVTATANNGVTSGTIQRLNQFQ